jgi:hypothetical protein
MKTIQVGKRNDGTMYAAVDEEALDMGVMPLIEIAPSDIDEMGEWQIVRVEYDTGYYPMSMQEVDRAILSHAWDKMQEQPA